VVRERGEGGNVRAKRAPGRWRIAASYLMTMWFSAAFDGSVLLTPEEIVSYDSYLKFNDFLLDYVIKAYGVQPNEYGRIETADWEKVRTPYVRSVMSWPEYMEIAAMVYAEYIKMHPIQTTIAGTARKQTDSKGATQFTAPRSPNPEIVGPFQAGAPCAKCHKPGGWRVSIPGEKWLPSYCADHLGEVGLEPPTRD